MAANPVTSLCNDTTEAIPLNVERSLFLKPIAKIHVSVQLPQMKSSGKSISNWEVMEKLKSMAKPEKFIVLKVIKSALEFIRLEGEIETKNSLSKLLAKLDGNNMKLSGFPEQLKVRAVEAKSCFPTRHDWDSYFRDAKNMDEMRAGERPDTVHISDVPCKWFADRRSSSGKPCEKVVEEVFSVYGDIRCVDIPLLDPYREDVAVSGGIKTFTFGQDLQFDVFIQFKEYMCFVKCMEGLRGMKLMHVNSEAKAYTANIKVEFDKTKHLSEKSIKKRVAERQKIKELIEDKERQKQMEKEEEEKRREELAIKAAEEKAEKERRERERQQKHEERQHEREQKRKQRALERRRLEEERLLAHSIAIEERKILIAQRKLESVRLLSELMERVKRQKTEEEVARRERELLEEQERLAQQKIQEELEVKKRKLNEKRQREEEMQSREQELRQKIIRSLKEKEEKKQEIERENLRRKLNGQVRLKSTVVMNKWLNKDDH